MVVFLILAVRLIHIIQILFQFLTFTDLAVVYKSFCPFFFYPLHYNFRVKKDHSCCYFTRCVQCYEKKIVTILTHTWSYWLETFEDTKGLMRNHK
jgi:hypothetical protein